MTITPDLSATNLTVQELKQINYFEFNKFQVDALYLQETLSKMDLIKGSLYSCISKTPELIELLGDLWINDKSENLFEN